ncbi:viroplasmin family protein [Parabacteroides sp. OttesenSCG-928-J18]|nr:viroplasmin family protein [Parabacteroides sp. OttesenSCG-928-J18]
MSKSKFYVVWNGVTPGIYDNWTDTKLQIEGFAGAKYKSFPTREEADEAYQNGYFDYLKQNSSPQAVKKIRQGSEPDLNNKDIEWNSLSVDAACSGNPGDMEYRGVYTATGQEIFHVGPMKKGTNNVGEFLALVHGLALLQQKNSDLPIYTDSVNAMKWVKNKKAKTLLERLPENVQLFNLIERAEHWLKTHTYKTQILKWNTAEWGEIPADFGRK